MLEERRALRSSAQGQTAEWRQQGSVWLLEPAASTPCRGLIEFIGGSYLAATPQLSYRRLLESLASRGWRVHAWSYVPGFDHQSQATEAWRAFRRIRERESLASAGQSSPNKLENLQTLRVGHSLGCKLHLLAPDAGRQSQGLVALAFNNYSAERSVPFLSEVGQQLGFRSEFSPSPAETLRIVHHTWRQPRNLLVRFHRDALDQSARLLDVLRQRAGDASELMEMPGDHLTPASAGLRRNLLGDWADDPSRQRQIDRLAEHISHWIL